MLMLQFLNFFGLGSRAVALSSLLLFCSSAFAQGSDFSKLVVFGDSLSDTGNIAIIDLPPPYYENRISNGPVLADRLAGLIDSNADNSGHLFGQQIGFNYAVSGANVVGDEPEDVTNQIDAFLERSSNQADPRALYFIFVGGNDLRGIRGIRGANFAEATIQAVIDSLESQVIRLTAAGARAFLIANVPNVGRIPETLDEEASDAGISQRATEYTIAYNAKLTQLIDQFANDQALSIVQVDVYSAFENLLNNFAQFRFTNIRQGCFDVEQFEIDLECVLFGFDRRVFFDNVHPSAATNEILASMLFNNLPVLPSDVQSQSVLPAIIDLLL